MKIVIINGREGSGKDQFVKYCKEWIGDYRCYNYSTVDFVKYVAVCAGWKGEKSPKDRLFLSNLKKVLTAWDDIPVKKTLREVADCEICARNAGTFDSSVMFIHCREVEEVERLRDLFDATVLLVERLELNDVEASNSSDANVYDCTYDCIIENNSTLDVLKESARTYLEQFLGLEI